MAKSSYKPVESNENTKSFILIGTFRNEKIVNELHLAGKETISKNLTSSPDNWGRIIELLRKKKDSIDCVALSLSESVLLIAQCQSYKEKFNEIINLIQDIPHMIFLYEDNRFSKFNIFNTRYYKKYLFYDDFFINREVFKELTREYDDYGEEVYERISTEYFYNTIIPAVFLAEEDEWNSIRNNLVFSRPMQQLSLFDVFDSTENEDEFGDYYYKREMIEKFIDSLRSELSLTKEERELFQKMPSDEQILFIDTKCKEIRKNIYQAIKTQL